MNGQQRSPRPGAGVGSARGMRAVVGLSVARFAGIVLSLATSILMASRFGTASAADAFFFFRRLTVGSGESLGQIIKIVWVPGLVDTLRTEGAQALRERWLGPALRLAGTVTAVAVTVALLAPVVVSLLAPGFDAEQVVLSRKVLRVLVFCIPGTLVLALLASALNASRRFAAPAFVLLTPRLLVVLTLLFLVPPLGIVTLSSALLAGTLIVAILLVPLLRGGIKRARPPAATATTVATPGPARLRGRYLPLLLLHVHGQITIWIDLAFATTAGRGGVSVLEYGTRLMQILPTLVADSLVAVMHVDLAHHAADGDDAAVFRRLLHAQRVGLAVLLPLVGFLWIASDGLVGLVLKRGAFDAEAAGLTAAVMRYTGPTVLFTFISKSWISKLYVDRAAPRLRVLGLLICFALPVRITLDAVLVRLYGVPGLAVAVSIASGWMLLVLHLLLRPFWGSYVGPNDARALGRIVGATSVAIVAMLFGRSLLSSAATPLRGLVELAGLAIGGGVAYLVAARMFRVEELTEAAAALFGRRRRGAGAGE